MRNFLELTFFKTVKQKNMRMHSETIQAMFGINHRIYLDPVPQARHRMNGHRAYDPSANHRVAVQQSVLRDLASSGVTNEMFPLTNSYVWIEMTFFISRPNSHFVNGDRNNIIRREYEDSMPTASGDIDNYVKLLLDALDGIFFRNDSNVIRIVATKLYCIEPDGRTVYNVHPYAMNTINLIDNDEENIM